MGVIGTSAASSIDPASLPCRSSILSRSLRSTTSLLERVVEARLLQPVSWPGVFQQPLPGRAGGEHGHDLLQFGLTVRAAVVVLDRAEAVVVDPDAGGGD